MYVLLLLTIGELGALLKDLKQHIQIRLDVYSEP